MSVYIFLTTFFFKSHSRLVPSSLTLFLFRYLSFERTCLSSLFIVALSLFLSPSSFPKLPRNACAFHPEKWIFLFGKKAKKVRIRYTLHEGRFWPACKRSGSERTSVGRSKENDTEKKGVEGRGKRIGSKTAMGKMKTTHLRTRSEREGKVEGGERHVVSPESGNLTTAARKGERGRAKRTLIICAFRTSEEQKAPRIL